MARNMNVQKKKTTTTIIMDILFKMLIAIAVIIFIYIALTKVDFSSNKVTFTTVKKSEPTTHTPSQLKWFDDFRGVENVPDKNAKKKQSQSGGGSNSGFNFQGFNK